MNRFIFVTFLVWSFLTAWAQEAETLPDCSCNSVDELIGQVFQSNIQESRAFLGPGSDPFGIQMSVRVRIQASGEAVPTAYTAFNLPALNGMAGNLAREQRFDRYDLDGPGQGGININDQVDLTFLIECNETYTEDIEPLVLEGTTSPPGRVYRKTLGCSVVRIQSKVINDFFDETFINNVTGAPADDKNKVISFSSEKYSFDPADENGDGWQKAVGTAADYDGGANSAFIFPAREIDGKMQDSDLFLVDSIAPVSPLQKKLQNKKWELLLGPAYIEGQGFDKEIIVHREARPVSLRELKQSKENKSAIRLVQELEYKQGYNTNFVGLGKFMDGKELEGLEVLNKLIEDPTLLNQAIGGIENMEKINPEMAGHMRAYKGHKNMAVFMRSAYGLNKYSGMLESWASKVKIKREITLRPVSAAEADKYLTSRRAFEITGVKDEPDIDPGQLKDGLNDLFKSK